MVSPTDAMMAWTLEPELLASSTIGGSIPEGALVTEGVPSAPVGPTPMVATADPSVGARSSQSLVRLSNDPFAWGEGWLDPSDSVFTLNDPAEERYWTSMRSGLESIVCSLTYALGVLKDDITPVGQVCRVFTFSIFKPYLNDSNLTFS